MYEIIRMKKALSAMDAFIAVPSETNIMSLFKVAKSKNIKKTIPWFENYGLIFELSHSYRDLISNK